MLGYADERERSGPWDGLIDPLGQGPAVWFQGGKLHSDAEAPASWVLADAEGNEACVTTWPGRDG